ncbi:unnamed protein product [Brassica rapa subsp. narinosa]
MKLCSMCLCFFYVFELMLVTILNLCINILMNLHMNFSLMNFVFFIWSCNGLHGFGT